MVGHILGLGDRHLDNILMDFCSGDMVHIDYNVCFDKGQRLKIPEIVPFRLTQTIEAALGMTGIEGTFRSNCESVIGVLRKNKDILLMLLEVFVWDPLVEWTRGDFHDDAAIGGEERKGMELAVSLSLFASRVQEIRVPLQVCIHSKTKASICLRYGENWLVLIKFIGLPLLLQA
jgi:PI-3-kinase-related kinase SMG-1